MFPSPIMQSFLFTGALSDIIVREDGRGVSVEDIIKTEGQVTN